MTTKTQTIAIIAAILAAADDLARVSLNVASSENPARFIDDAAEIVNAAAEKGEGKRY